MIAVLEQKIGQTGALDPLPLEHRTAGISERSDMKALDLIYTSDDREGAAYLQEFQQLSESRFAVIKVGGKMVHNSAELERVGLALAFLWHHELYPVVVHGGGVQINKALRQSGIESSRFEGKRVTSSIGSLLVRGALDSVNDQLCRAIEQYGGQAEGIKGGVFGASIENPEKLGRVGRVERINTSEIFTAIASKKIPIVSCIGNIVLSDKNFLSMPLNINGDTAAVALAGELKPQKFISLTRLGAVYDANGKWVKSLTREEAEQMITNGSLDGGMRLKVLEGLKLHAHGVHDAVITKPAKILPELFTDGAGTIIRADERGPVHVPPALH